MEALLAVGFLFATWAFVILSAIYFNKNVQ